MANKYQTVSCHFYDELEALAVKKVLSNITYLENENEITHHKWHQYDIWQYSSKGNINGINANVDLNIMYSYLF